MWSNVVEETGEPGENHRTWTGDHYPATRLDPDSNPDRRGDKRVRYPLCYPGPLDRYLICILIGWQRNEAPHKTKLKIQARLVHFGSGDTITNEELWVGLGISGSLIYAFSLRKAVKKQNIHSVSHLRHHQ